MLRARISKLVALLATLVVVLAWTTTARAAGKTLYVATTGNDGGNNCQTQATPCKTINKGIESMTGGDTLIIGDGTYAESIVGMPNGTAGAYTVVKAQNDWGVTIDGSGFPNNFRHGISFYMKSYVEVRGFKIKMNQANENNEPIIATESDHIKIIRCGASYSGVKVNTASIDLGPNVDYALVEECYSFGGGRYQFIVFESNHVIVRRSVARGDYWNDGLQCAGFTNYDSANTVWQNNVAIDMDDKDCQGHVYGGFFNENKPTIQPDTTELYQGNIVLNVNAFYAGDLDWLVTGTRTIQDMVIWGGNGGYWADQGPGNTAALTATRMTLGATTGTYDGPNTGPAQGSGFAVYGNIQNSLTHSISSKNKSFGVTDWTKSDYNRFSGNGASYGGQKTPAAGANDKTADADIAASLKYLVRVEPGSPLKTAGQGGAQIGAEIMFKYGKSGTLYGEAGWDQLTTEPLWPYPNEDQISKDMGSYTGPGGAGKRGFTAGNSKDGTPQSLTKYIWESLGNQIPPDVYGFHIAVATLVNGVIGKPYTATVSVGGGTAPYAWSLTAGTLPPGLALDGATGAITGTPTALGQSTFTISVSDSKATKETVSKQLGILVVEPGSPGDPNNPANGGDGGVDPTGDGGASSSSGGGGGDEDDGCGCHTTENRSGSVALVGLTIVVASVVRRRRNAKR